MKDDSLSIEQLLMSQKRLAKWCQQFLKNVNHFMSKSSKFSMFRIPHDFVQISPLCGPNDYQTMYGHTLDFQCQRHNGNIRCLI